MIKVTFEGATYLVDLFFYEIAHRFGGAARSNPGTYRIIRSSGLYGPTRTVLSWNSNFASRPASFKQTCYIAESSS